jgi:hypothetical protein
MEAGRCNEAIPPLENKAEFLKLIGRELKFAGMGLAEETGRETSFDCNSLESSSVGRFDF